MKKIYAALLLALCSAACLTPLPAVTTLPDVQLPVASPEEAVWNSADYDQKPVLLVFMGSWCPYCKMTIPAVNVIAEEYGDKVEIVGVFMDADAAAVKNAAQEHKLAVKAVYNGGELAEVMEVQGLPHTVLFNKKHEAVKHWEGFDPNRVNDFREGLQKVVK